MTMRRLAQQRTADLGSGGQGGRERSAETSPGWLEIGSDSGRCEHREDADQHVVTRGREPGPATRDPADGIIEVTAAAGRERPDDRAGERPRPRPRDMAGRYLELGDPFAEPGRVDVIHLRYPADRGSGVDHGRADTEVTGANAHRVVDAEVEVAGYDHAREVHGESGIVPAACDHGPQLAVELEVHGVREHAVDPTSAGRVKFDDRPDRPGSDSHDKGYEIAAITLSESDTQPKMAPCAFIISNPTR